MKSSVPTRWNSVYHMLDSTEKNYDKVVNILDTNSATALMQGISKTQIEPIIDLLSRFYMATVEVEKSKSPSLYLVQPWYSLLTEHLEENDDDDDCIKKMKNIGLDYIEQNFVLTKYHQSATFLHPHLKHLDSVAVEDQSIIKYQVIQRMRYTCSRFFISFCRFIC